MVDSLFYLVDLLLYDAWKVIYGRNRMVEEVLVDLDGEMLCSFNLPKGFLNECLAFH